MGGSFLGRPRETDLIKSSRAMYSGGGKGCSKGFGLDLSEAFFFFRIRSLSPSELESESLELELRLLLKPAFEGLIMET